jgi:hypothetical protein
MISQSGKTLFLSQTNLSNITHKVTFPITSLTDSLIFNDFSNWKASPFTSDLPNITDNVTLPFQIGQLIIGCQALVQVHLHDR